MKLADQIRSFARNRYVVAAREKGEIRFSIRSGDVADDMKLVGGRIPAVCSALKTRQFLRENGLHLISMKGPGSGQSTTMTYTYEFDDVERSLEKRDIRSGGTPQSRQVAWEKLRGALKDVFAEYGGGEAYMRAERAFFRDTDERK